MTGTLFYPGIIATVVYNCSLLASGSTDVVVWIITVPLALL